VSRARAMSLDPVDSLRELRARSVNSCTCCGLPFAAAGVHGRWSAALDEVESEFAKARNGHSCFDMPQDTHFMHKLQRTVGRNCYDGDYDFPAAADGAIVTWDGIRVAHVMRIVSRLGEVMKQDLDDNSADNFRFFDPVDTLKAQKRCDAFYDTTVPACVRCNTLMTLEQRTTDILIAHKALVPEWCNVADRKGSNRERRNAYAYFVRKCAIAAKHTLRAVDARLDTGSERVLQEDRVALVQVVILSIAACLRCVPSHGKDESLREHEHFRATAVRRFYLSAVMWTMCRIRWASAFHDVGLADWHCNYTESMPLTQMRSWHRWLFGSHQLVRLEKGRLRASYAVVVNMMRAVYVPAMLALMTDSDELEKQPSIWQLMYVCCGRRPNEALESEARLFFPPPGYGESLYECAMRDIMSLDAERWIQVFGKYIYLRRMAPCVVFSMPRDCALRFFTSVTANAGEIAGDGAGGGAPPETDFVPEMTDGEASANVLSMYQTFLDRAHAQVHRFVFHNMRERYSATYGRDTLALEADFAALHAAVDAATAYERTVVPPGYADADDSDDADYVPDTNDNNSDDDAAPAAPAAPAAADAPRAAQRRRRQTAWLKPSDGKAAQESTSPRG
jgi:hypothetical protein